MHAENYSQLFVTEIFRYLDHGLWLTEIPAYGRRKDSEPHQKCSPPIHNAIECVATKVVYELFDLNFDKQSVRALGKKTASELEQMIVGRLHPAIGKTSRPITKQPMVGIIIEKCQGWVVIAQFDVREFAIRVDFPYCIEASAKEGLYDAG